MEILEEIVRTDNKQRDSFNEDKTLIRANQGHSIPVDVELEKIVPPELLYHGTGEKYRKSIDAEGLKPKGRLYVHLSRQDLMPIQRMAEISHLWAEWYLFYTLFTPFEGELPDENVDTAIICYMRMIADFYK